MIEVKITGPAVQFLKRAPKTIPKAIAKGSRNATDVALRGVRESAPVQTGFLRDSHRVRRRSGLAWFIAAEAGYSGAVQRRTQYLDRGLDLVRRDMERNLAEAIEAGIREAAG